MTILLLLYNNLLFEFTYDWIHGHYVDFRPKVAQKCKSYLLFLTKVSFYVLQLYKSMYFLVIYW